MSKRPCTRLLLWLWAAAVAKCSNKLVVSEPCKGDHKALPVSRWPELAGSELRMYKHWAGFMRQFDKFEVLAVAAFIHAIKAVPTGAVIDVGSNLSYYANVAALLGAPVLTVDMQPLCSVVTKCHLELNQLVRKDVFVQNAFVSRTKDSSPIQRRLQLDGLSHRSRRPTLSHSTP